MANSLTDMLQFEIAQIDHLLASYASLEKRKGIERIIYRPLLKDAVTLDLRDEPYKK